MLNKIHHIAYVGMTGSMSTFPSNPLEVLLDKTRLFTTTETESCLSAHGLPNIDTLKPGNLKDHREALRTFVDQPAHKVSDPERPHRTNVDGTIKLQNLDGYQHGHHKA